MYEKASLIILKFVICKICKISILLRHRVKNFLESTRFRVHSVFKNFHSGERIQKITSCAGFTGDVWTEAAPGKKKLRIQKYPDTCGRDLMYSFIHSFIHSYADDSAHRAFLAISKSHVALAISQ